MKLNKIQKNYIKAKMEMKQAVRLSGEFTESKLDEMGLDIIAVYESKDEKLIDLVNEIDTKGCELTGYFEKLSNLVSTKKVLINWVFSVANKLANEEQKETIAFLESRKDDCDVEEKIIDIGLRFSEGQ